MNIIGLNAYHGDSSACLVRDGELICAIEEERIRRIKHWAGLPTESVKWCMEYAGLEIADIDYIAISRNPSAHLHKKILRVIKRVPKFSFLKDRISNVSKIGDIKGDLCESLGIEPSRVGAQVINVEHHRAHLASAFFVSPFPEAVVISVDGFGDFLSVMRGVGNGQNIEIKDWVEFPHSLGVFYTALTQYLGFWKYGDEYKIMGLSAYGEPKYAEELRRVVLKDGDGLFKLNMDYFLHDKEGVDMVWNGGGPVLGRLYSGELESLLGPARGSEEGIDQRHSDIASSVQRVYEEVFFGLLNETQNEAGVDNLCLAGGCIQNSLANGKIYKNTHYKNVYIPPAASDAGTSVGAAFWVWNQVLGNKRSFILDSASWGPHYSDSQLEETLSSQGVGFVKLDEGELLMRTAEAVAGGKIVGWFQGRTELGPRALGNRSIVADPRNPGMKDILNQRIKRREGFRPYAPVILKERVGEWFEQSSGVPFMEKVYGIKEDKRPKIPAVTHKDGTGRLQTVTREFNPRYYGLIEKFEELTGVPIVLNTSFNENEPIVNDPKTALDCYLRTNMDVLVLGDYFISN